MSRDEKYAEQVSRVRQMAAGSPTWDLSPSDVAALKAIMDRLDDLEKLADLVGAMKDECGYQ